MIEEPRQPLTDANLNAIRDVLNRHRISYQWSASEIAAFFGGFTPPTPQEIDDSITALLMEVAQRRQQEASLASQENDHE